MHPLPKQQGAEVLILMRTSEFSCAMLAQLRKDFRTRVWSVLPEPCTIINDMTVALVLLFAPCSHCRRANVTLC
jgi:hypothetical protein